MTLDEKYQQTIDDQRVHLLKLQEGFNKKCDEIKESAITKLKDIPEGNKEARENVLKEQKEELNKSLSELKQNVDQSTRETMKRLEGIVHEKELKVLEDLEKQMQTL